MSPRQCITNAFDHLLHPALTCFGLFWDRENRQYLMSRFGPLKPPRPDDLQRIDRDEKKHSSCVVRDENNVTAIFVLPDNVRHHDVGVTVEHEKDGEGFNSYVFTCSYFDDGHHEDVTPFAVTLLSGEILDLDNKCQREYTCDHGVVTFVAKIVPDKCTRTIHDFGSPTPVHKG